MGIYDYGGLACSLCGKYHTGTACNNVEIVKSDYLLTAEPEPCEDEHKMVIEKVVHTDTRDEIICRALNVQLQNADDALLNYARKYASRVSDKRVEELQRQLDMSRKINRITKDIAIRHMRVEKKLRAQVDMLMEALKLARIYVDIVRDHSIDEETQDNANRDINMIYNAITATCPKQENNEYR